MTNYPQSFLVPDPHLTTCAFKLSREKNPHLKEARILSERLDEFLSRERHSDRYNFRNCSVSIRLFFVVVTKGWENTLRVDRITLIHNFGCTVCDYLASRTRADYQAVRVWWGRISVSCWQWREVGGVLHLHPTSESSRHFQRALPAEVI